jgi:hypothetical protein
MNLNLEDKISFRIGGEIGEYQTISIDKLYEIANNFQVLINSIAKNDIEVEGGINLCNFKIELCGFKGGSAIPEFCFTNKIIPTIANFKEQRREINASLEKILQISDSGDYLTLISEYPEFGRRNEIVEALYSFRSSFGKSPIEIGYYNGKFNSKFKLKEFNPSLKKAIIVEVETGHATEKIEYKAFGQIKVSQKGKKKNYKVEQELKFDNHSLTYSPEIIIFRNTQYLLKYQLHCNLLFEDGCFTIKNEILDIVAVEEDKDLAENSFNEQFDYLYNRLKNAEPETLSNAMLERKYFFGMLIKEISIYGN